MKSLTVHLNESLVNESKTVCGLCPVFDPGKPNQKEFKKVLEPIFQKLKDNADEESSIFKAENTEACAAIVKGAMDFLIRNLDNIEDDFADEESSFSGLMSELFDGDYEDILADGASKYYDFDERREAYNYIEVVSDDWTNTARRFFIWNGTKLFIKNMAVHTGRNKNNDI